MKILVIGGSGLIGSYLVESLVELNHTVYVTSRSTKYKKYFENKGANFLILDIQNIENFSRLPNNIDVVIHLASIMPAKMKGYQPQKYIDINISGTLNVLEYCKTAKVSQIIYTQSHSDLGAYWGKKIIEPYDSYNIKYGDDHTVYIISKIAAVELIKQYHAQYGIKYAIFRCPNIYAYYPSKYYYVNGEKKEIAYRKLIDKAIKSETIEIWGDCKVKKDIVYVKDLIQMIASAIDKEIDSSIYNVSTGVPTSLEEQILGIVKVFSPKGKASHIEYRPEYNINLNNHRYSIDNAIKELNYQPKYYYIEMLKDIYCEMMSDRFKEVINSD